MNIANNFGKSKKLWVRSHFLFSCGFKCFYYAFVENLVFTLKIQIKTEVGPLVNIVFTGLEPVSGLRLKHLGGGPSLFSWSDLGPVHWNLYTIEEEKLCVLTICATFLRHIGTEASRWPHSAVLSPVQIAANLNMEQVWNLSMEP